MPLKPLNDTIVVERLEAAGKTPGGIILTDGAKERPQRGKVIAVGPGRLSQNGEKVIPVAVKVNDIVMFERHAGRDEIEIDGKKVLIMGEASILGTIE